MAGKTFVSRRLSEFIGVVLFALALIWLISLASYSPADPVFFFTTGADGQPLNFGGRVGAFLSELSYQMLGYSAYLAPVVLVVSGWHYFWCRVPDATYTKLIGAGLLFGCVASFLSLAFGTLRVGNREILAGGYVGQVLSSLLAEYLNKTGSIILILTLLFLSIVLSTQFSFGRFFAVVFQMARDRWAGVLDAMRARKEERRREKQRQEVLKKHLGKDEVLKKHLDKDEVLKKHLDKDEVQEAPRQDRRQDGQGDGKRYEGGQDLGVGVCIK